MSTKIDLSRVHISGDKYPLKLIGFYTAHAPFTFDNTVLDPKTGELRTLPSMTKQEFKDQCDINKIVKEFTITGQISHISAKAAQGAFLDLPKDLDYQTSLNTIIAAEDAFMALPAKVRDRFGNDPTEFLTFVTDPKNADELVELGIRERPRPASSPAPIPEPAPGPAKGGSESKSPDQPRQP